MHTRGSCDLLDLCILLKQSHWCLGFACQHRLKKSCQRKTGALNFSGGCFVAQLGTRDELLHRIFHAAQHDCGAGEAHHLQRAHRLVQLLAGDSQLPGVYTGQVRTACQIGIPHITT